MGSISFLSKSRGLKNLLFRIFSILSRFGITSGKFDKLLREFGKVTSDLGCQPTFAVTAVTLKRNPEVHRELSRQGVEFAVHGYVHTDYGVVPLEEQVRHFSKAIDTFANCRLPYTGYRAPFLRTNEHTCRALNEVGFAYDSSSAVHWDVLDVTRFSDEMWREYQRLLDFYGSHDTVTFTSLPRITNGLLEIPVSIPDDEALVERLGVTGAEAITDVWDAILRKTYERGELFTLQLHPERIELCKSALANAVKEAGKLNPGVWVTTLREIAAWWREKDRFTLEIQRGSGGRYPVTASCSERATILLKNCRADTPLQVWYGDYLSVTARQFDVECPVRPVIGLGRDTAAAVETFLRQEGYVTERNGRDDNCALYLEGLEQFGKADEKPLIEKIESSKAPLLRYWRWPDGARSALSVTGDIDATTLVDFGLRIMENWWQKRRNGRNNTN